MRNPPSYFIINQILTGFNAQEQLTEYSLPLGASSTAPGAPRSTRQFGVSGITKANTRAPRDRCCDLWRTDPSHPQRPPPLPAARDRPKPAAKGSGSPQPAPGAGWHLLSARSSSLGSSTTYGSSSSCRRLMAAPRPSLPARSRHFRALCDFRRKQHGPGPTPRRERTLPLPPPSTAPLCCPQRRARVRLKVEETHPIARGLKKI